ncbi:MAG: DDE-type integrase/transposase/recombinase [Candidatus Hodarchaeaceae archaeon]|nr:DDE-type integrase/transposase/recombinase [Candidatus Hodarchaeaceae archaeon]
MNPKCPACGTGSWKNGFSRSGRRVYKCKSCGRKFNDRAGTPYWHLKKEERDVLTASLLYTKYPLSTYQVADLLELFGVKVSASSVGRWPQRFGHFAKKIAKRYRVKFSKIWHVDEKFTPHKRVPSERWKRGKRKWAYQITVLDSEGNVVASYLAPERSTKAIRKPLRRAKEEAGFSPEIVVSDKYNAYDRGVNVLGRRTRHIRTHFKGKLIPYGKGVVLLSNNKKIERYHSQIAPKIRSMRGIKNLEEGDRFFQVHNFAHNFSKKGRLKRILGHLGLKPNLDGLTKLFYIARNF